MNSRANRLNAEEISCIVQKDGFRLWGNRGCAIDPAWAFISVVRTADIIGDSLQAAHLWALDRCTDLEYQEAVLGSVNAYLRYLMAPPRRAIQGGQAWVDPARNTKEAIADGRIVFSFDFTPCYPAERITFDMILTNDYIQLAAA